MSDEIALISWPLVLPPTHRPPQIKGLVEVDIDGDRPSVWTRKDSSFGAEADNNRLDVFGANGRSGNGKKQE